MKVNIDEHEMWPVYSLDTDLIPGQRVFVIPDGFYEEYVRVGNAYREMQDKIGAIKGAK